MQQHSCTWSIRIIDPQLKDVGDDILRHIVAPLTSQLGVAEGGRFRFSRNLESGHPSVLLHLCATDDVINHLWTLAHALADENVASWVP